MNIKEIKINAQLLCNKSIEKENFFNYLNNGIREITNKKNLDKYNANIFKHFKYNIINHKRNYYDLQRKNHHCHFNEKITSMHQVLKINEKYHESLSIYIALKEREKYYGKKDNITKELKYMYKKALKK